MDGPKKLTYPFILVTFSVAIAYLTLSTYDRQLRHDSMDKTEFEHMKTVLQETDGLQKEDYSTKCLSCEGRVPNVVLQYGVPRTATTLQFYILCLMMIMSHEDEVQNVGCFNYKDPGSKYKVIKTHTMFTEKVQSIPPDAWVFLTSNGTLSNETDKHLSEIYKKNLIIRFVVDLSLVLKRGFSIVYEYQPIFGVTDAQIKRIAEHLRFWDILRVCCGKQLSRQWKHVLTSGPDNNTKGLAYPACEMYNICQVEQLFIETYISKQFRFIPSLKKVIGKPSPADGILDGSYCESCNRNITMHKPCVPF